MQIAFHIGAHSTDEDRLFKSVLKNANTLLQQGIAVPGPSKYRVLIRETIQAIGGAAPSADTRDILIDAICENDDIDRIVLVNDNFICIPRRIFDDGMFYAQAESKVRALQQLFAGDEIELFLSIRNPATFLQETMQRTKPGTLQDYLGALRPTDISWADVVARIKQGAPDSSLTVWCTEDSPLLWEQLVRRIADTTSETKISGGLDMLSSVITPDGMRALRAALDEQRPLTDADRHDVIADIWEAHTIPDCMEEVIDIPELDPGTVAQMTENYDRDLARIAAMDGVTLMLPFT